ncbi:ribosome biogenesis protein Nop53/GLTSCR2 [Coprinopsis sp. MPI-PUGE-AT-0042]|nr:ribosome biogenesis protein Nop53/GLTSCR2 [Coprinopsis sp. MPI-PUGE-AT-0042]
MAKDSTSKVKATKASASKASGKKSATGAPSQLGQSSRKGKKAWRKNVDIQEVEQGLEEIRAEERVVGTAVQNLKDDQLFQIDVKGDDNVRHVLPKFDKSQLTSAKILAQRSAVPAVFSRPTSSSQKRKANVSREDKERLLRIAKRPRKGPFNSVQDTSEFQSGEGTVGLSEAVKASGSYDAWVEEPEVVLPDGLETVHKKKVKAPVLAKPRDQIDVPAVLEPHQGTSYNPPVEAHQELLVKAAEIEAKKVAELEKMAETKKKMEAAKLREDGYDWTLPPGMQLDRISQVSSDDEEGGEAVVPRAKQSKMKTQAQKNRAARVAAEQRALSDKAAKKKLLASIEQAKSFRKATARQMSEREKDHLKKRLELQEKMKKMGLAGQKLGKHKVPEGEVSVQIGEDLSESLRGLKPEGNLFRDRFQSLQQRALIEPRNLVLPKRRKHRIVEYEKHAWKRFDRD